jgi:hypothetical protein
MVNVALLQLFDRQNIAHNNYGAWVSILMAVTEIVAVPKSQIPMLKSHAYKLPSMFTREF